MTYIRPVLTVGSFAFLDSYAGLVPCKVLDIKRVAGLGGDYTEVRVQITAARGPYRRGESLTAPSSLVVPRKAVRGHKVWPYDVALPETDGNEA